MRGSRGAALVLALMAVTLLTALGLSLSVLTTVETRIAGNFSQGHEAGSAAEAALEFAVHELQGMADWPAVAAGGLQSTFVEGLPEGIKLSDGSSLSLTRATETLGEPGWKVFAYGEFGSLAGLPSSNLYVVVWATPDPEGRPDTMVLRADAFGPAGTRRAVQATLSRTAVLSWSNR